MYKEAQVIEYKQIVLEELSKGKSLDQIVREDYIKDDNIVYKWLNTDAQFKEDYGRARLKQLQFYGERIQKTVSDLPEHPTREQIAKAALSVDADKWIASRMLPKVYGSNTSQTNIQVNVQPVTGMSIIDEAVEVIPIDQSEDNDV